jgi:hypothetical protein
MHWYSSISKNLHVIDVRISHTTKRENFKLTSSIYMQMQRRLREFLLSLRTERHSRIKIPRKQKRLKRNI